MIRSTFFALAIACAIPPASVLSQGSGGALLAPAYPGAVAQPYPKEERAGMVPLKSRLQEFLSKDPAEKVKAFYAKSVGPFGVSPHDSNVWYGTVIPEVDIYAILEKRGYPVGEAGGEVTYGISGGVTVFGDATQELNKVYTVIEALKAAHVLKFQDEDPTTLGKHLEDPELKQAVARYQPLRRKWYLVEDGKSSDERAYEKYYVDQPAGREKEIAELSQKMQELTMQQKYDEATRVGDRLMKLNTYSMDAAAAWDDAVTCLQEMEQHAFTTKIVIDKHPSGWDLSGIIKK